MVGMETRHLSWQRGHRRGDLRSHGIHSEGHDIELGRQNGIRLGFTLWITHQPIGSDKNGIRGCWI
jgi:hypothetical protein